MSRLFGTDGVRGIANQELTPELALELGQAAARALTQGQRPRFIVGRDTRVSGEMLECALAAGLTSAGADVVRVGIVPTPGVAYLVRELHADAGAMISASHNPVPDNGIKFFDQAGYKLDDETEDRIEAMMKGGERHRPTGLSVGRIEDASGAWRQYADFLKATAGQAFSGLRVVIDAACGAAWQVAPHVYRELGADVVILNDEPDGASINVKCGSTHPEVVCEAVRQHGAHAGLAYDGDADRLIAADENGNPVNGDRIMAICGLHLLKKGELPHSQIAATVYSNLGLIDAFRQNGGDVVVTQNGDRYVLEALRREGLVLGGEQSGHIIFLGYNTTGDGILSSLQLLKAMVETGRPLSELAAQMREYPQVNRSVRVAHKHALKDSQDVVAAVRAAESRLGNTGRIFVRASGTEPVVRVMAEGPDQTVIEEIVAQVADIVHKELN